MIRSLYTAVSGMITLENKQSVVSNNMANANTTGFKSSNLVTKSFKDVLVQNMDGDTRTGKPKKQELGTMSLGVCIDENPTKFTQGDLKDTGRVGDFAINGNGFFTIQHNDSTYYSRDGQFHVNNQGFLVNTSGDKVLGFNNTTGALEPIKLNSASDFSLDINNRNTLVDNSGGNYRFAISTFDNYGSLIKVGDNYYSGEGATFMENASVNQRFLELSNVNITSEMIDMLTTMRSFETAQKFVQMIDESMGKAANEVGRV